MTRWEQDVRRQVRFATLEFWTLIVTMSLAVALLIYICVR